MSGSYKQGVSGLLVKPDGSVLMGMRKGSHGSETYANPGGHVEQGETQEHTLDREILEETNIDISHLPKVFVSITYDEFGTDKNYRTSHYLVRVPHDTAFENREPDKCSELRFYSLHEMINLYDTNQLFLPMHNLLMAYELLRGHRTCGMNSIMRHWFELSPYHRKVWLFSGPAGSGKGTQGKILQDELGITHASTGEIFRRISSEDTDDDRKIKQHMDAGNIIPSDLAFPIMSKEFSKLRYQLGFMLDGYPKDLESMEFLLKVLKTNRITIMAVFYFDIAYELNNAVNNSVCLPTHDRMSSPSALKILSERLSVRLLCNACETNYHPIYCPPREENKCDKCGHKLTYRSDDQDPSTIARRIKVFCDSTLQVIRKLSQRGHVVIRIDACLKIDDVTLELKEYIANEIPEIPHPLKCVAPAHLTNHHTHLDGPSLESIEAAINGFHSAESGRKVTLYRHSAKPVLTKIYPVQHLVLGKQTKSMAALYKNMGNFHDITDGVHGVHGAHGAHGAHDTTSVASAQNPTNPGKSEETDHGPTDFTDPMSGEAFATLMYGENPDFEHMAAFMKYLAEHPEMHMQFEYEEEIYSTATSSIYNPYAVKTVELDLVSNAITPRHPGDKVYPVYPVNQMISARESQMTSLAEFDKYRIPDIPRFELRHGFDIPKDRNPTLPIPLADLHAKCEEHSNFFTFDIGGWFIFEKTDRWAYRSNEFFDGSYDQAHARLEAQQTALVQIIRQLGPSHSLAKTPMKSSIEIVYRIWKF